MKGKYISTSLMLAVLAGGKEDACLIVDETAASTNDHKLIWSKEDAVKNNTVLNIENPDELKIV